jgi:hypothetical protein
VFDKQGLQDKKKETVRSEGMAIANTTATEKEDVSPECRGVLITIDVMETGTLKARTELAMVGLEEAATSHLGIRTKATRKRVDMKIPGMREFGIGRGETHVDKIEIGIEGP